MADSFRAVLLEDAGGRVTARVAEIGDDQLPDGDVTVAVEYSTINYKDGLILGGLARLVRTYPHVPGVDFAGTVTDSKSPEFSPGDKVVLTGWRVGETWWGGYAERARVKSEWLLPLPEGLDTKRAMAIGTAGLTAAMALGALEEEGVKPERGELLVTGAAGGLGSIAVALAARRGFRVVASSGRPETADYLKLLGAAEVIDRANLAEGIVKPLETERWAGAIDTVGSTTLAKLLTQCMYYGVVASCGNAGGNDLPASVIPFILRGVRLLGIDSVFASRDRRQAAWARLAAELPLDLLDRMTTVVGLARVPELGTTIVKGGVRGRTIVDVRA